MPGTGKPAIRRDHAVLEGRTVVRAARAEGVDLSVVV